MQNDRQYHQDEGGVSDPAERRGQGGRGRGVVRRFILVAWPGGFILELEVVGEGRGGSAAFAWGLGRETTNGVDAGG